MSDDAAEQSVSPLATTWVEPKLGPTLVAVVAVTAVVAVVAVITAGGMGAVAAVVSSAITAGFFFGGAWLVNRVAEQAPNMLLAIALLSYAVRLIAVFGSFLLLRAAGLPTLWLAVAMFGTVMAWLIGSTVAAVRVKQTLNTAQLGSGG